MYSKILSGDQEAERECWMCFRVEGGDPEIAGGQACGNAIVWQRTREDDAVESSSGFSNTRQLRTIPDKNRANIVATACPEFPQRRDDMDRAVPVPERAGENGDGVGRTVEWYRSLDSRTEPICVGSPFELHDLRRWCVGRQDCRTRGHDHIGLCAQVLAPTTHRLEDQRAIEQLLAGPGVINDRGIHLEYCQRPHLGGGPNTFAAEVVVALDDDIRLEVPRQGSDRSGIGPSQLLSSCRRRERDPANVSVVDRTRRCDENVNFVPEARQSFRNRNDVNGSARGAGDALV